MDIYLETSSTIVSWNLELFLKNIMIELLPNLNDMLSFWRGNDHSIFKQKSGSRLDYGTFNWKVGRE